MSLIDVINASVEAPLNGFLRMIMSCSVVNTSSVGKWGVGVGGSSKRQNKKFEILKSKNYRVLEKSFCKILISQINF